MYSNQPCTKITLFCCGVIAFATVMRGTAIGAGWRAVQRHDVVVYGGTPAGITAALTIRRSGRSVIVIEPGRHLGGLTAGGLGATDIGNKRAIGGLARAFYQRVWQYYEKPSAWIHEHKTAYQSKRQQPGETTQWTFEPHVAEQIFGDWLRAENIPVVFAERLDRKQGTVKSGTRIQQIVMESGKVYMGTYFVDATYEGDLMAGAKVRYHVGRESNATYGETLNGVQTKKAVHHQFTRRVDPFVKPGDPTSGLLPGVQLRGPGVEGAGDQRVQAYGFRLCTTDVPANRQPWPKPADYDPGRYELLLRNFEAGDLRAPWHPVYMPNRKTDTNNNFAISTDHIGMNYAYPEADYATREAIFRDHEAYQKGLMWTLANHPRVPSKVQAEFQRLGLAKDEFRATGGWPHQLYIREARRMIGAVVMTEHHCRWRTRVEDAVGLAAYGMDSHHVQRYVDAEGNARNEGDVQVPIAGPFPISFRAIVPAAEQCTNLLVPVCLSASHIAYGSIRMEPVFMVLGQSAGTAAVLALERDLAIQEVPYDDLKARLLAEGQILSWQLPAKNPPTRQPPTKIKQSLRVHGEAFRDGDLRRVSRGR